MSTPTSSSQSVARRPPQGQSTGQGVGQGRGGSRDSDPVGRSKLRLADEAHLEGSSSSEEAESTDPYDVNDKISKRDIQ